MTKRDPFERMGKKRGLSAAIKRRATGRYVEAKQRLGQRARAWDERRHISRDIEHEAYLREKARITKERAYKRGIQRARGTGPTRTDFGGFFGEVNKSVMKLSAPPRYRKPAPKKRKKRKSSGKTITIRVI